MTSPNFRRFYNAFREIITIVHSTPDIEELMELVVWKIVEILSAKGAIFRLLNLDSDELELSAAYGIGKSYLEKGPRLSHKIITDLCLQDRVILIDDIHNDPRIQYPKEAEAEGIKFIIDVPLTIGNDAVGIMRIYFSKVREFNEDEQSFIIAIAEQCSCALSKARLIESHELKYHQLVLQTEKLSSLGRMAAGIAHEINNPLAGILLYSSNMAKKVAPDSRLKEGLDIITHETVRCRKIIQELLDFSREKEPKKQPFNINEIIDKALAILENEFRLSRIEIKKNLADNIENIMVDSSQIEQVFVNLLINAVQAMPGGGIIWINSSISYQEDLIVVEIKDNGPGIIVSELDKIFEPFFSSKPKGSGLGLSVSYGIIHNHLGRLRVESDGVNGTSFLVELPILHQDN
ncbi:MAG: GAF domain-containing protein [Desulfobulbaceae bacterium]|nr:GAF domain-containing protein [Desulfobulbaceae bacterium]